NYLFNNTGQELGLTTAAVAAGWSLIDVNHAQGPLSSISGTVSETLDCGTDTFTINSAQNALTVIGGGQAGDNVVVAGNVAANGSAATAHVTTTAPGTTTIHASTAGTGTTGYTQASTSALTTGSTTATSNQISITANAGGGSGDVVLADASVGGSTASVGGIL